MAKDKKKEKHIPSSIKLTPVSKSTKSKQRGATKAVKKGRPKLGNLVFDAIPAGVKRLLRAASPRNRHRHDEHVKDFERHKAKKGRKS